MPLERSTKSQKNRCPAPTADLCDARDRNSLTPVFLGALSGERMISSSDDPQNPEGSRPGVLLPGTGAPSASGRRPTMRARAHGADRPLGFIMLAVFGAVFDG